MMQRAGELEAQILMNREERSARIATLRPIPKGPYLSGQANLYLSEYV